MDGPAPHPGDRVRPAARPRNGARPPAWRYWRALPPTGKIGIFMNAWYREALVDRLRRRASTTPARRRICRRSGSDERMLSDEGIVLLKFWIHLSRDAQKKRLARARGRPEDALAHHRRATSAALKLYSKSHDIWEHVLRESSTGDGALVRRRGHRRALPQPDRRQDPARRDAADPRREGTRPRRARGHAGAVGHRQRRADPRPRPHEEVRRRIQRPISRSTREARQLTHTSASPTAR